MGAPRMGGIGGLEAKAEVSRLPNTYGWSHPRIERLERRRSTISQGVTASSWAAMAGYTRWPPVGAHRMGSMGGPAAETEVSGLPNTYGWSHPRIERLERRRSTISQGVTARSWAGVAGYTAVAASEGSMGWA